MCHSANSIRTVSGSKPSGNFVSLETRSEVSGSKSSAFDSPTLLVEILEFSKFPDFFTLHFVNFYYKKTKNPNIIWQVILGPPREPKH